MAFGLPDLLLSHTRHQVPGIAAVYSSRFPKDGGMHVELRSNSSSPDVIKDD